MEIQSTQSYKLDNAIIMAAGTSSRFAPLSYEYPKSLLRIKGEILIERQIRQLKEAGIHDITVVVGYKKELFYYLAGKFSVNIVENPEYNTRNNHASIYYVRTLLKNTYICSADNYFTQNIFQPNVSRSYYSSIFHHGKTNEWCILADSTGLITDVTISGEDSWIMLGHAFFSREFSKRFVKLLESIYDTPSTFPLLWEHIYIDNIHDLPMYIKKYPLDIIFEFDTLDELRRFDSSYYNNSGSSILKDICDRLQCREMDIVDTSPIQLDNLVIGFSFLLECKLYTYNYATKKLTKKNNYQEV